MPDFRCNLSLYDFAENTMFVKAVFKPLHIFAPATCESATQPLRIYIPLLLSEL